MLLMPRSFIYDTSQWIPSDRNTLSVMRYYYLERQFYAINQTIYFRRKLPFWFLFPSTAIPS
jgi:hypothetical protein